MGYLDFEYQYAGVLEEKRNLIGKGNIIIAEIVLREYDIQGVLELLQKSLSLLLRLKSKLLAKTGDINVCTRDKMHAYVYNSCAHIYALIFVKFET